MSEKEKVETLIDCLKKSIEKQNSLLLNPNGSAINGISCDAMGQIKLAARQANRLLGLYGQSDTYRFSKSIKPSSSYQLVIDELHNFGEKKGSFIKGKYPRYHSIINILVIELIRQGCLGLQIISDAKLWGERINFVVSGVFFRVQNDYWDTNNKKVDHTVIFKNGFCLNALENNPTQQRHYLATATTYSEGISCSTKILPGWGHVAYCIDIQYNGTSPKVFLLTLKTQHNVSIKVRRI